MRSLLVLGLAFTALLGASFQKKFIIEGRDVEIVNIAFAAIQRAAHNDEQKKIQHYRITLRHDAHEYHLDFNRSPSLPPVETDRDRYIGSMDMYTYHATAVVDKTSKKVKYLKVQG